MITNTNLFSWRRINEKLHERKKKIRYQMYIESNKNDKVILANNRKVPLANRWNKKSSWNHTCEPFLYV